MMPRTIVSLDPPLDGPTNMARDIALWEQAEEGKVGARVYSWEGPWVSLGISQHRERDLLPGVTIPSVVRPTGGKAVLHGHDMTVGLALPLSVLTAHGEDPCFLRRRVRTVYRRAVPLLIRSLNQAGIRAALGDETSFVQSTKKSVVDCFASVAPNDIVDPMTGQKVCGCALRLGERSLLIQASIPVRLPLVDPRAVFDGPSSANYSDMDSDAFVEALEFEVIKISRFSDL